METRNIALTLDKAKEWYNSGNEALKETALQAFTEEELTDFDFRRIKTFFDAVKVFRGATPAAIADTYNNLSKISKASAASFKLNIIRKVLNKGHKMSFTEGDVWYPINHLIIEDGIYKKGYNEVEVAEVEIDNKIYILLGGDASYGAYAGLGCATKEIAGHFGKYFAKEIFEAKYGDLIDYEWID